MRWVDSLRTGTEWMIVGENAPKELLFLLRHARQYYLPLQMFDGCTLLRGTLGKTAEALAEDSCYVLFWQKQSKSIRVARLSRLHEDTWESSFDVRRYSIVVFWSEHPHSREDPPQPIPEPVPITPDPPPDPPDDADVDDYMHLPSSTSSSSDGRSRSRHNSTSSSSSSGIIPTPPPAPPPPGPPGEEFVFPQPQPPPIPPQPTPGPMHVDPPDPPPDPSKPRSRSRSPPRSPSPDIPPWFLDELRKREQEEKKKRDAEADDDTDRTRGPSNPNYQHGGSSSSTANPQSTAQPEPPQPHVPVLPIHSDEDDDTDSSNDSQTTREAWYLFKSPSGDIVVDVDAPGWRNNGEISRILAVTSSFSRPTGVDGPLMWDHLNGETSVEVWYGESEEAETTETALAVGKAKPKRKVKARKEATKTELRQYSKQFLEAKHAEYKSWVENEVFELVDLRKVKARNFVTGRWVLTIKRNPDGSFQKCKARWVLRGFLDKQKDEQQTDSPTATRPGFRLACQLAAINGWDISHVDLKTAFLQGEQYDHMRDVICQLPPESGHPPYIGARLVKPAYGMNDAPRQWWNKIDKALRGYGMIPTRADRCTYVLYEPARTAGVKTRDTGLCRTSDKYNDLSTVEKAMDYLTDPIAGSPAKGMKTVGVICLHVDDLFITGGTELERRVLSRLRKDFQVGSEGKNDVIFCGQYVRWSADHSHIEVEQYKAVEELREIDFDKTLGDAVAASPSLHTAYRSVLGSLNWLQSRTQFHIAYKFSRCASASAAPTIGDIRNINKVVRGLKAEPVSLRFWPLKGDCRIVGMPDASYRNNEDKSSQRGQCLFIAEMPVRDRNQKPHSRLSSNPGDSKGSLVDYESQKINRTTLSTTVSELFSFMKCFGTALFLKGLWFDISALAVPIHMRTDANNLVTTASTTHLPEQKETIHMISMLRKEAQTGSIDDLSHIRTENCLSDCLTKNMKPDTLVTAVKTGTLPLVDRHPPFRTLLKHKAYLASWIGQTLDHARDIVWFLGENVYECVQGWFSQDPVKVVFGPTEVRNYDAAADSNLTALAVKRRT